MAEQLYASNESSGSSGSSVAYEVGNFHWGTGICVKTGSHVLSSISFYVKEIGGSLTGLTYVVRVYSGTGYSTVGTLSTTSNDVNGSDIAVGWVNFTFPSPPTVVDFSYVVFEPKTSSDVSTSNYIVVGMSTAEADSGYSFWTQTNKHSSGDYSDIPNVSDTNDSQYKAYETALSWPKSRALNGPFYGSLKGSVR